MEVLCEFGEFLGLLDRPVVDGNLEAVVGDVEGEVLTHHGEPDESDVGMSFGHGDSDKTEPHSLPQRPTNTNPILSHRGK